MNRLDDTVPSPALNPSICAGDWDSEPKVQVDEKERGHKDGLKGRRCLSFQLESTRSEAAGCRKWTMSGTRTEVLAHLKLDSASTIKVQVCCSRQRGGSGGSGCSWRLIGEAERVRRRSRNGTGGASPGAARQEWRPETEVRGRTLRASTRVHRRYRLTGLSKDAQAFIRRRRATVDHMILPPNADEPCFPRPVDLPAWSTPIRQAAARRPERLGKRDDGKKKQKKKYSPADPSPTAREVNPSHVGGSWCTSLVSQTSRSKHNHGNVSLRVVSVMLRLFRVQLDHLDTSRFDTVEIPPISLSPEILCWVHNGQREQAL